MPYALIMFEFRYFEFSSYFRIGLFFLDIRDMGFLQKYCFNGTSPTEAGKEGKKRKGKLLCMDKYVVV
jgi:hypothetical protein